MELSTERPANQKKWQWVLKRIFFVKSFLRYFRPKQFVKLKNSWNWFYPWHFTLRIFVNLDKKFVKPLGFSDEEKLISVKSTFLLKKYLKIRVNFTWIHGKLFDMVAFYSTFPHCASDSKKFVKLMKNICPLIWRNFEVWWFHENITWYIVSRSLYCL